MLYTGIIKRRLLEGHGLRVVQQLPMPLDAFYVSLLSESQQPTALRRSRLAALRLALQSNRHAARHGGDYSSLIYVAERPA